MADRTKKHVATGALMRRLWREHITHYKGRLGLALIMMIVVAGCTAAFAKLIEPILDEIFIQKNGSALWPVALSVLFVFTMRGLATYGEAVIMNGVGQGIIRDIQNRMFRHIIQADLSFFHSSPIGTLISRFTYDVNMLRYAVSNTITGMGKDIITLAFLTCLLFYQDMKLATIALVVFPMTAIPIVKLGRKMRKVANATQGTAGVYTALLEQIFNGIRQVKSYHTEAAETARAEGMTQSLYKLSQKSQRVRSLNSPIMEFFAAIAIFIIIVYGGSEVMAGTRTAGAFFSFITALLLAYEPLKSLAKINAGLQEGLAAAQRIYDMLAVPPHISDAPQAKPLNLLRGEIRFEKVGFTYEGGVEALRGVDLSIPAGKTVALVGSSGSGKTTILNLIPRFYDVKSGAITIDGQDIRKVTLLSLREKIGLVSQETILFDDTILANISYGQGQATMDQVIEAAKRADAHDFIMALPDGYDTVVGAHGVKISGGQRQRIAVARAMLKNAPILLLDEATSALDTETERQVQSALKKLMAGRTTIIVAHRLSTIVDADLIYVIDEGRIVESGTHAELLYRKGAYAKLYEMQFQDIDAASAVALNA